MNSTELKNGSIGKSAESVDGKGLQRFFEGFFPISRRGFFSCSPCRGMWAKYHTLSFKYSQKVESGLLFGSILGAERYPIISALPPSQKGGK